MSFPPPPPGEAKSYRLTGLSVCMFITVISLVCVSLSLSLVCVCVCARAFSLARSLFHAMLIGELHGTKYLHIWYSNVWYSHIRYDLTGAWSGMTQTVTSITLHLPPDTWPAALSVGPSIAIFEMPAGAGEGAAMMADAAVAGLGVTLGPGGTRLSKPVTISVPVHADFDLGNRVLRVHRYSPPTDQGAAASWTPVAYPEGYTVPNAPGVVEASVRSLRGAYAVLAVPPHSVTRPSLDGAVATISGLPSDAELDRQGIGSDWGPKVVDSGGTVTARPCRRVPLVLTVVSLWCLRVWTV